MAVEIYETFQRGMALLRTGDPARAAVLLERVKKEEPQKASIREALGRAYFKNGQFEKARHHFNEALVIDPTNDFAHYGLALSLGRLANLNLALGHIKMALSMNPENKVYQRLGLVLEIKAIKNDG